MCVCSLYIDNFKLFFSLKTSPKTHQNVLCLSPPSVLLLCVCSVIICFVSILLLKVHSSSELLLLHLCFLCHHALSIYSVVCSKYSYSLLVVQCASTQKFNYIASKLMTCHVYVLYAGTCMHSKGYTMRGN